MEAKKSHHLPSANWKTRKVVVSIHSEFKVPRTRSVSFQGQKKVAVLVQRKSKFALLFLFCSLQALNGLDGVHSHWWGQLLWSVLDWSKKLGGSDPPRNNILPATWSSLGSVKLMRKISHHDTQLFWHFLIPSPLSWYPLAQHVITSNTPSRAEAI